METFLRLFVDVLAWIGTAVVLLGIIASVWLYMLAPSESVQQGKALRDVNRGMLALAVFLTLALYFR